MNVEEGGSDAAEDGLAEDEGREGCVDEPRFVDAGTEGVGEDSPRRKVLLENDGGRRWEMRGEFP